ncbi:hypothetical protein GKZ89_06955 [Bacillus mangrovi]|uniref:Uncharacterized protein n=1 Tax=Metabacillus mangrovi TaxID=1491830 RepID=A0A7X2S3Q4_9BACI|nr:hypothetical protein [Metabacillus mangrovi]MTH53148.1 hypothetical protein [Metabacillus mangrovi]
MKKTGKLEAVLWSIAFPGFGQLLNGHFGKGIVFIALEIVINVNGAFNLAIKHSFNGDIAEAFQSADLQWLMFYPCVYFFAMYDAYKYAGGASPPYSFLPFAFSAYFVTVGVMLAEKIVFFGVQPGPVWVPMIFTVPGLVSGFAVRAVLLKLKKSKPSC